MALVCSGNLEVIDLTTARSSACFATSGKRSLTHVPDWPRWANFHGDCSTLPTLANCVGSTGKMPCGSRPWYLASAGLWSNVSTWLGPPSMYRKMTALALALGAAAALPASIAERATAPKPLALRASHSRRVGG